MNFTVPLAEQEAFRYKAALYFMDDTGCYLLRMLGERPGMEMSKFISPADVAAAFAAREEDSGWLAPGVVRCGHNARGPWFVYSAPGQKVEIQLEGEEPMTVAIPRTVLVGIGRIYRLYALAGAHFETSAKAYTAPFPNVYHNGKICWGSSGAPVEAEPKAARGVWEQFFKSAFNGDLATDKARGHTRDVRVLLRELAERKANTFPKGSLMEIDRSIGRVIDEHLMRED